MLTVNYQTHFSSIHSWRYKQNVYSEFVFVYKLNSYMKAAWAITGAHTKLHAIVAALSIKLEQQQPFVRITLDCS